MVRVTFVTGCKDALSVCNIGAIQESKNGADIVLNISLMGSATMFPASGVLHNVLLVDRCEVAPGKNNRNRAGRPGEKLVDRRG